MNCFSIYISLFIYLSGSIHIFTSLVQQCILFMYSFALSFIKMFVIEYFFNVITILNRKSSWIYYDDLFYFSIKNFHGKICFIKFFFPFFSTYLFILIWFIWSILSRASLTFGSVLLLYLRGGRCRYKNKIIHTRKRIKNSRMEGP